MPYEKRDGSGALFKNDRQEREDQPGYKGDILIDGQEYWLSGWIKDGKNGKFFSLQATRKDAPKPAAKTTQAPPGMSEDIPF